MFVKIMDRVYCIIFTSSLTYTTMINWPAQPRFLQEIWAALPSALQSQKVVDYLVSRTEYQVSAVCAAETKEEKERTVSQLQSQLVSIPKLFNCCPILNGTGRALL
jgi:hypothetical protein